MSVRAGPGAPAKSTPHKLPQPPRFLPFCFNNNNNNNGIGTIGMWPILRRLQLPDESKWETAHLDDEDSILSESEYPLDDLLDEIPPKDHHPEHTTTSLQRWDQVERTFRSRNRLIRKITQYKSPAFIQQLQQREYQARNHKLKRILARSQNADERLHLQDRFHSLDWSILDEPPPKFLNRFWFTASPILLATVTLVLHCLAHCGIMDLLDSVVGCIKENTSISETSFHILLFAFGALLLKSTGDLYWWMATRDYELLRLDYHNRLRLGTRVARIMRWIRNRPVLRLVVFIVGYHACYAAASYGVARLDVTVVLDPPSARHARVKGTCPAEWEMSYCEKACQDLIASQEAEFLYWKQADLNYTWRVLTASSYDAYWLWWMENHVFDGSVDDDDHEEDNDDDERSMPPLVRNDLHILVCGAVSLISFAALRLYGVSIFEKY